MPCPFSLAPSASLIYVFTHICQQFVRPTNKFIGVLPLFKQRVHCPACPITKSTNSASHLPLPLTPTPASLACPSSSCVSSMSARWHILNILCLLHISPLGQKRRGRRTRYRRLRLMTLSIRRILLLYSGLTRTEKVEKGEWEKVKVPVLQAN